jgi:hypothetical protein
VWRLQFSSEANTQRDLLANPENESHRGQFKQQGSTIMLELFIYTTSQNILASIVRSLYAALNRIAGHSDDSDATTPQTPSQEPMGDG